MRTETCQYYDSRVFSGPDREIVAREFVDTLQATHPGNYPVTVGADTVTVDLAGWPEDVSFPRSVWEGFLARGVTVVD